MKDGKKLCQFCSKEYSINNITPENLPFFDDSKNITICAEHRTEIMKLISESKL